MKDSILSNTYVIERFQNPGMMMGLYNDLSISMCPSDAPQIQTVKGNTDCCQGSLVNGKCQGKTVCTLSPTHDGIPSCIDYWKMYFTEKSNKVCPKGMTYYFEDIGKPANRKGCSVVPTEPSGKKPTDESARKCIIYNTQTENVQKSNSCYNEKLMGSIRCPEYKGEVPKASKIQIGDITIFSCSYIQTPPGRKECLEDSGYKLFLGRYWPNWETQPWSQQVRDYFCSNFVSGQQRQENERNALQQRASQVNQTQKLYDEAKASLDKCQKDSQTLERKCSSLKPENCESSRQKYLKNNPDVANAKMDPWSHWNQFGKNEGRPWPPC